VTQPSDHASRPDLVPLAAFASLQETLVVINLLKTAGIQVFYDERHDHASHNPQLYVTRETLDNANRVIERARWHSHVMPQPASPREEPRYLMTAILWIVTIAMLVSLLHSVYKLIAPDPH
jgi:hypothetical protein